VRVKAPLASGLKAWVYVGPARQASAGVSGSGGQTGSTLRAVAEGALLPLCVVLQRQLSKRNFELMHLPPSLYNSPSIHDGLRRSGPAE
jgi:hypothetical protein